MINYLSPLCLRNQDICHSLNTPGENWANASSLEGKEPGSWLRFYCLFPTPSSLGVLAVYHPIRELTGSFSSLLTLHTLALGELSGDELLQLK